MQSGKYSRSLQEKIKTHYKGILLFILFTVLTAIVTFPLIISFRTSIYGGPGDPFGTIWHFWWLKYALRHNLTPYSSSLIAAPFGVSRPIQYVILNYIVLGLSFLFNEVVIYNLLIFISFPLSAFFTYLLVYYLTKNRAASFFAGIAFAFSPFNLAHALAHLTFVQWIPLYVFSLLKFNEKRTYISAILCGLSFSLVFLFNFYFGFFMLILTLTFIVFTAVYSFLIEKQTYGNFHLLIVWAVFFLSAFAFTAPFIYSIMSISSRSQAIVTRSLSDLFIYSTRLWEYIVPPLYNPIVGRLVKGFVNSHLHGSNTIEQTLYLGIIPLSLFFYAMFSKVWKKEEPGSSKNSLKFAFSFFVIVGLVSVLFSFPPFVTVKGLKIYFPSLFLYRIVLCSVLTPGLGLLLCYQLLFWPLLAWQA